MLVIDHLEALVDEDVFLVFSEFEHVLPVDEDAVWVGDWLFGVPFGVVVVDAHPGDPGGEARMLLFVPMAGCSASLLKMNWWVISGLPEEVYGYDPEL